MNHLWSPWRSEYIEAFKEKKKSDSCVLCSLIKEDVENSENLLVNKGELTVTVLNLFPYNNGHLMIIPFRHTDSFLSLSEDENLEIMKKIQSACKALTSVFQPEGFNIGANIGKISGAGIDDHIHFHIVPRWNGDTNFMPVLGEVKVISQDLLLTKKKLLEAYRLLE
jgi:ATP adenylyltransferase